MRSKRGEEFYVFLVMLSVFCLFVLLVRERSLCSNFFFYPLLWDLSVGKTFVLTVFFYHLLWDLSVGKSSVLSVFSITYCGCLVWERALCSC